MSRLFCQFIFIWITLFSIAGFAEVFTEGYFYSRYDKKASGAGYDASQFNSVSLGYLHSKFDFSLEYSRQNYSDGNQLVMSSRVNREVLVRSRYRFSDSTLSPFISIGVGLQQEEATTGFSGQSVTSFSRPEPMASVGSGVLWILNPIYLGVEIRGVFAKNYSPNPTLELGGIIGTYLSIF